MTFQIAQQYSKQESMSVKRPEQPDLRSEHAATTRSRVLRAARTLFARRGYSATTIATLAGGAGVAVQTLYSAFGSKAGIARAVVEEAVTASGIREAMAAPVREPDAERALRQGAAAATPPYAAPGPAH